MTNILVLNRVFPLGYEVDLGLFHLYMRSLDLSQLDTLFLTSDLPSIRFKQSSIVIRPDDTENPCWIFTLDRLPAKFSEARKAQLAIAEAIGLLPALFYDILPDYYDEGFLDKYRKLIRVRCIYGHPCCIRPSHLRLCDVKLTLLKTLYRFEDLLDIRQTVSPPPSAPTAY